MIQQARFGKTNLSVTRIALGGYPFGGVNQARDWDPFSPAGRQTAIATVHAALDAGINYIDTAPSYGDGNSESIIGEATHQRRAEFTLATKVGYRNLSAAEVTASVESSLRRLRTDMIDVIQFHGGMYTDAEVSHILNDGLLDALVQLRDQGKVRFLGFTVEEPWTAQPLIASGAFDVMQVRYNLIYQAAALHVLNQAKAADLGVATMRTMTSGMLQRIAQHLAPGWQDANDLYTVALQFVLSDSRVHLPIVGMRWPEEVARNVALVENFQPSYDMAALPRLTAGIYRSEDEGKA
ncbi:MAG: aldo/keto reductase [Caldilineaceae bacterium]|nr:aldo/keto reductase [Caldilineaceae bacterium]